MFGPIAKDYSGPGRELYLRIATNLPQDAQEIIVPVIHALTDRSVYETFLSTLEKGQYSLPPIPAESLTWPLMVRFLKEIEHGGIAVAKRFGGIPNNAKVGPKVFSLEGAKPIDYRRTVISNIDIVEQHGPHSTIYTDAIIAKAICRTVAERYPEEVTWMPGIDYGKTLTAYASKSGTISIPSSTLIELVKNYSSWILAKLKPEKLIFIMAHGPAVHHVAVQEALADIAGRFPNSEIYPFFSMELANRGLKGKTMMVGHASRNETMMVLLFDKLFGTHYVDMEKAEEGHRPGNENPSRKILSLEEEIAINMDWNGVSGYGPNDPRLATRWCSDESGLNWNPEDWLEAIVEQIKNVIQH